MKRPQITPGPWKACREITRGEFVTETRIRSADDSHIAHVTPCAVEANARAIAALPSVYEAASNLVFAASITDHGEGFVEVPRDYYQKLISALTLAGYEF